MVRNNQGNPWWLRILENQGFAIVFGLWVLWIGTDLTRCHRDYLAQTASSVHQLTVFTQRVDNEHAKFEMQLVELRRDQQQTASAIIEVLRELKNVPLPPPATDGGGA
jgi:hypothetical protein